jgi:hypothetical protein
MNVNGYKNIFIILAVILTAWFGFSRGAYAETDYSQSKLNRDMQKIMDTLPKNKEQPYTPYRPGDTAIIRGQIEKAKESGNQAANLRAECANNNDDACIEIGIDINDPCRPFTNNQDIHACYMQQCNNGSQGHCDKINTYNNRMKQMQEDSQRTQNNHSQRTQKSACWSSKVNCNSLCRSFNPTDSYCTDKCDIEYQNCQN